MIEVALVGCGYMGRRHAAVIARDPRCRLVSTVDLIDARAQELGHRYGATPSATVPLDVDAVVVATPTHTHCEVAAPVLARGAWCLVEKPLANGIEQAAALSSPRLVVGHIERFNPAVRAAGPLRPRHVASRREAPPSGRSADIDVVLDLMIHDIDLVLHWSAATTEVEILEAAGVAVLGTAIDTARVRLRTSEGLTAVLVASRVAEVQARWIHAFEPGRQTALDLLTGRASRHGRALAPVDDRDALTAQWEAFTGAIQGRCTATVGGHAGLRAVALAERICARIQDSHTP